MKNYYRVMLGKGSIYANEAKDGGFIGADFIPDVDLSGKLPESWRDFNKEFIPVYLKDNPGKAKVTAGLACASLWVIAKGILGGDIVLSPDGSGKYMVGEVVGDYFYVKRGNLPHRRKVNWFGVVDRASMSQSLQNSTGSIGTYATITKYADELSKLIDSPHVIISASDETVEDPATFALEKHLEDFLVQNWKRAGLATKYDIYQEEGELIGQQYPTDTGTIDILAISKDKKELLVIELKKGRASDVVVGQVQRYMGYVKDELAEKNQNVKGLIIAFEEDVRLKRALSVAPNIDLMFYEVNFKLKSSKK